MRNKSEKGPRRPPEMSEHLLAERIRAITVGQTFRVWYHDVSRYNHNSGGYSIDNMCLVTKEESHMLEGAHCDFICSDAEGNGITAKCNEQFYIDHAPLFHAIEIP